MVVSVPLHRVISDIHELEITPGPGLMEHGEYQRPNILVSDGSRGRVYPDQSSRIAVATTGGRQQGPVLKDRFLRNCHIQIRLLVRIQRQEIGDII